MVWWQSILLIPKEINIVSRNYDSEESNPSKEKIIDVRGSSLAPMDLDSRSRMSTGHAWCRVPFETSWKSTIYSHSLVLR